MFANRILNAACCGYVNEHLNSLKTRSTHRLDKTANVNVPPVRKPISAPLLYTCAVRPAARENKHGGFYNHGLYCCINKDNVFLFLIGLFYDTSIVSQTLAT